MTELSAVLKYIEGQKGQSLYLVDIVEKCNVSYRFASVLFPMLGYPLKMRNGFRYVEIY